MTKNEQAVNGAEEALKRLKQLCNTTELTLAHEDSFVQFYESWLPKVMEALTLIERNQRNSHGKAMAEHFYNSLTTDVGRRVGAEKHDAYKHATELAEQRQLRFMFGGDVELFEFYKELAQFDWWYSQSDDNRVYQAGLLRQAELKAKADSSDKFKKVYEHVAKNITKSA